MIRLLHAVVSLFRPAFAFLLALVAAVAMAAAGHPADAARFGSVLLVLAVWLIHAAALNDVADREIDKVNLAHGRGRPLVAGTLATTELGVLSGVAAVLSVAGAAFVAGWSGAAVVAAGCIYVAVYSLPPVRLSARGWLVPLTLPFAYVAVPFLLASFSVRSALDPDAWALLVALYVAFAGRIVLKDFRDLTGDAMYGKRTVLLRYGRRVTCRFSATLWVLGCLPLLWIGRPGAAFIVGFATLLVMLLMFMRELERSTSPHLDEALISGIASLGRGIVLLWLMRVTIIDAGWSVLAQSAMLIVTTIVAAGMANDLRHGRARRHPIAAPHLLRRRIER